MRLAIHYVTRPKSGERTSGDAPFVRQENGVVLFAVIAALGHGVHAAPVADKAVESLSATNLDRGVREIMGDLHKSLQGTRGAAAMICKWAAGRVQGCGVGNVEMALARVKLPVIRTPGIIGVNMRSLHVFEGPAGIGSRMILYSDGISSSILSDDLGANGREAACGRLMEKFHKSHDDATLMVADVEGV